MGYNSAFKGLTILVQFMPILVQGCW